MIGGVGGAILLELSDMEDRWDLTECVEACEARMAACCDAWEVEVDGAAAGVLYGYGANWLEELPIDRIVGE